MPNAFTEARRVDAVLAYEQDREYSRETITLKSGASYPAGAVLGAILVGPDPMEAAGGGNTGDGALGAVTLGAGARPGVYTLTCVEAASDGGRFQVADPDGAALADALVGEAYSNGHLAFTIADGATDFAVGDSFTVTVAASADAGKYRLSPDTGADGSAVAAAVLLEAVDATAADATGVAIVRGAVVKSAGLAYDPSVDGAAGRAGKHTQLAAAGIVVRDSL